MNKKFKVFVALVLCLALVGGTFYFAGGKDMLKSRADGYEENEKGAPLSGNFLSSLISNLSGLFGGGGSDCDGGGCPNQSADLSNLLSGNGLESIKDLFGNGSLSSLTKLLNGGTPNISAVIKKLANTAMNFANTMYSNNDLKISDIRKINNPNGQDEYQVSYIDKEEKTPYGYSVIGYDENAKDFRVNESCINKGQGDLISTLTKKLKEILNSLLNKNGNNNGLSDLSNLAFGGDLFKNGGTGNYGINIDGLSGLADIFKNSGSGFGKNGGCNKKDNTDINSGSGLGSDDLDASGIFDIYGNDMSGGFDGGSQGGGHSSNGNKAGSGEGKSYSTADEIFEDARDISSGDTIMLDKYNKKPELMDASVAESKAKKYACAVQASVQCAYMDGLTDYNSQLKDTYTKLWDYSSTRSTGGGFFNFGVTYGGTYTENMSKAYVKFAKEKGKSSTTAVPVEYEPSIDWFKKQIQANRPTIFGYGVDLKGEYCGHCISILGLREAKSGNSNYNYLVVYDSWGTSPKLLNYDTTSFTDCEAAAFDVK